MEVKDPTWEGKPVCPFNFLFYLDHVYVIGGVNQLGGLLSLPGRVIRQPGSQFAM